MKSPHRLSRHSFHPFSILLFALLCLACQPPSSTSSDASSPANSPSKAESPNTPESDPARVQVSYEPAYPADVSAEGLDADDTAQQEPHAADNTEHSHGDGYAHDHTSAEAPHGHGEGAYHAH